MGITTSNNDIKERLSIAYASAVAARAGCQIAKFDIDKDSIDVIIRPVSGPRCQVNLQMKATSDDITQNGEVKFSLPIKNYNDLRDTSDVIPHYLVILKMPADPQKWLEQNADELAIRSVAYFGNLFGLPTVANTTSRIVKMPEGQKFTVPVLTEMMLKSPSRIGSGV